MKYWLVKSEPDVFSVDDLANCPDQTRYWKHVRNYQARNFIRDDMQVGDQVFFDKCLTRIREHHDRGRTLVIVSHQLDLLASLCPRLVWLEGGRIHRDGDAVPIVEAYREKALAALRRAGVT